MTDPTILINRIGNAVADLRVWHHRAADLLREAERTQRCCFEVIERAEHQARLLMQQATDWVARNRELEAIVIALAAEVVSTAENAAAVANRAESAREAVAALVERCVVELAAAEEWLRGARAREDTCQAEVLRCLMVVKECEQKVTDASHALRSAEVVLNAAQDAWQIARRRGSSDDGVSEVHSCEAAVRDAEVAVARCGAALREAIGNLETAQAALHCAEVELATATADRLAAEQRVEQCMRARSHAERASQLGGGAVEYSELAVNAADESSLEGAAATEVVGLALRLSHACLETTQGMAAEAGRAWRVFHDARVYLNGASGSAESGMSCCQQGIIDMAERLHALTRFEEVGMR